MFVNIYGSNCISFVPFKRSNNDCQTKVRRKRRKAFLILKKAFEIKETATMREKDSKLYITLSHQAF